MGKLGISIYPEKSSQKEIYNYIDKAAENGFSRIFSCLLSVNDTKENIIKDFKDINKYAQSKGFEIILDVAPNVFDDLDISYNDLSFFKQTNADGIRLDVGFTGLEESLMTYNPQELKINVFDDLDISYNDLSFFKQTNADGIRLDVGFTGLEESLMTYNPQELKIEINMSQNIHYLDTIMDYRPNKEKLIGCHNFYPHKYSGLSINHFLDSTKRFNKYGLKYKSFFRLYEKI